MKSRHKVTRVELKPDSVEEYLLIGLVSAEADYKLCLALNKRLGISLKQASPVELESADGSAIHFSRFTCSSSLYGNSTINLFSNKSENDFLIRKLKKIDYFFQVWTHDEEIDGEKFASILRGIEPVTAVFQLIPGELKDKNLQYLIP